MTLYDLPEIKNPFGGKRFSFKPWKSKILWGFVLIVVMSSIFGFLAGAVGGSYFFLQIKDYLVSAERNGAIEHYVPQTSHEEKIINAVEKVSSAVVSIVITKDVPVFEEYYISPFEEFFGEGLFGFQTPVYRQKGVEKREIGGGTGFVVSEEGFILTNKHVVLDEEADYTVFTNDGRKFPARVLAMDPFQDLAVLKIERDKVVDSQGLVELKPFKVAQLGDSSSLQIGQTVVTIGNALGEFRNTISMGVVSGLGRTITASGGGLVETIEDVIQTDAAINKGNSGGPLLNLRGEVIGMNTATVLEAQNIGFAIPINKAKRAIRQVRDSGKIVYAFLGVRYVLTADGALISKGSEGQSAVFSGSAAEKAGLKEGDILLEFGGEKITQENTLAKIIQKYDPGDSVSLKILRGEEQIILDVVLGER